MDALNGSSTGAIVSGYIWNDWQQVHVGLDNGSGTYSGTVQGVNPNAGNGINLIKSGTGTQTFDNLANQPFRTILINAGVVDLSTATAATLGTTISGAGNLVKSGAGELNLTGTSGSFTGTTTVNVGSLRLGNATDTLGGAITVNGGILDVANPDTVGAVSERGASMTLSWTLRMTRRAIRLANVPVTAEPSIITR